MVSAVTEPSVLHDTRVAYDAVASLYAELFSNVLETLPMERALLAAFAELVQAHNAGPVADIGCGPGHVTAHVHALGPTTFGIDLSSEMVALARRAHPDLRFDEGSMTALDLADGVLSGILASYSTIHTPPQQLPAVFTKFQRVLVRVSTSKQETQRQHDDLDPICVKVFEEKVSGKLKVADRPGLQAALEYMRPGDMLTVQEADRLAVRASSTRTSAARSWPAAPKVNPCARSPGGSASASPWCTARWPRQRLASSSSPDHEVPGQRYPPEIPEY